MNKCCTKCSIEKPLTEFSKTKNIRMKDGYNGWCKSCLKIYYLNNKEKYKKQNEKWIINNPEKRKKYVEKANKVWKYKKSGIYEWYDGEVCLYVGQSKALNGRISVHKSWFNNPLSAPKSQAYLYPLLRQHQNAQIHIIEECSPEILLEREQYYIDTKKPLYNRNKI